MKTSRKNQLGFSPVIVLVAIVVVAVIAVAGLVVHNHNHKQNDSKLPSIQTKTTTQQKSPQINSTQQYLSITEWGVRLPLSSGIQDAYYTVAGSNKGSDGLPNTAWLGLTSLNSTGCDISNVGPSANATPVGSIIRALPTDTDPVSGSLYTTEDPNGVTIGSYYYAYVTWKNNTCVSAPTLQSINSAFATAAKLASSTN